jgi:predicted O-methyltransferase YrrM
MKNLIYNVLKSHHYKKSIKELRTLESKLITPQSRLAIPFLFKGNGHYKSLRCMQNQSEIEQLYQLILNVQPTRVLEIGTAKGGALYLWLQASRQGATVVSVDLPDGEFGGGYSTHRIPFYQSLPKPGQELHLVRADSHDQKTLVQVKKIFKNEPLDFLYIDGDHTYNGVKQDFELYSPLVRKGGIIGLHDILPRPDLPDIQVDKFWNEIKDKYKGIELIGAEGTGRRIGCGVIKV